MTLIRKLASALFLALLCSSYSNAQVLDYTTGSLTNFSGSPTTTTSNWNNGVYVNQLCFGYGDPGNCGPNPSIRASTGSINFSYGLTDLNQVINAAAAVPSNALNITGFTYSFQAKNGNGWDDGRVDTLSAYVKLYDKTNTGLLENYNYNLNQKFNWTTFNYNETFTTPRAVTSVGNVQYGFVGKDNNYWAGNYGPEIMNVNFALKYSVDPCKSNPAYSPTCAGFSDLVTSRNFSSQMYGINQALASAGSDIKISGLNYGYALYVGGDWCSQTFLGLFCTRTDPSIMKVDVNVTSSTGASLYSAVHEHYQQDTFGNYSYTYLFPTQRTPASMGNFSISPRQYGTGAMYSNWSNWIYTPDKCVIDPLSSSTCPGYAVAYAKNLLLGSTVSSASAPAAAASYSQGTTNMNTGAPLNNGQTPPPNGAPDPMQTAQGPAPAGQPPQQQGQQGPGPQQGPAPDPNQNPSVAQMDPAQPGQPGPQQQAGPAPTQPQPAGGPPQVTQQSAPPPSSGGPASSGSGPAKNNDGPKMSTSQALSIVKSVQEKDKAVQQMAIQNAAKVVEGSTQQSQATVVSALTSLNDMSASSAASAAAFSSQTTQNSIQAATQLGQPQQTTQSNSQTNQYNSGTGLTFNNSSFGFNSNSFSMSLNNNQQTQIVTLQQPRVTMRQTEVETPTQVSSFGGVSRAGNPLSEMMMQQRFEMMQSNVEQRGPSVNRNVQSNELAGGVDVASIATQPKGFELYSFMIKDTTFYPPKEVYRNQKVVDNVMVLRQMSSDRLHQEMVDSQYKEK